MKSISTLVLKIFLKIVIANANKNLTALSHFDYYVNMYIKIKSLSAGGMFQEYIFKTMCVCVKNREKKKTTHKHW